MNDLLKLAFNGHEIRTVVIDGNPWFMAADVARALGLAFGAGKGSVKQYLPHLAEDEMRHVAKSSVDALHTSDFPNRGTTCISESGLYRLVNRSDKAQARPFQDWVNREVLPAIRKDGSYVLGEEKVRTGEMTEDELVLAAMEAQRRKIERLVAASRGALRLPVSASARFFRCVGLHECDAYGLAIDHGAGPPRPGFREKRLVVPQGLKQALAGLVPRLGRGGNHSNERGGGDARRRCELRAGRCGRSLLEGGGAARRFFLLRDIGHLADLAGFERDPRHLGHVGKVAVDRSVGAPNRLQVRGKLPQLLNRECRFGRGRGADEVDEPLRVSLLGGSRREVRPVDLDHMIKQASDCVRAVSRAANLFSLDSFPELQICPRLKLPSLRRSMRREHLSVSNAGNRKVAHIISTLLSH